MSTELEPQTHITEKDVFERLEQLERAVYVPIVPGEVTQWLDALTREAKRVEETACEYFRVVHTELYRTNLRNRIRSRIRGCSSSDGEDDEICAGLHALVELGRKVARGGRSRGAG